MKQIILSTGSTSSLGLDNLATFEKFTKNKVYDYEIFFQSRLELTASEIKKVKEYCSQKGVSVNSIHPFMEGYEVPNLFSINIKKYAEAKDIFYRFLEICVLLNSKYLIMHGPLQNCDWDNSIDRIKFFISEAKKYNVDIAIENKDYTLFYCPKRIILLKEQLESDNWVFVLDFKSAWKANISLIDMVEAMGDRLLFSHVSFRDLENHKYGIPFQKFDKSVYEIFSYMKEKYKTPRYVIEVDLVESEIDIIRTISHVEELL